MLLGTSQIRFAHTDVPGFSSYHRESVKDVSVD